MKTPHVWLGAVAALALAGAAQAQVRITEVAAWGSSAVYGNDWFELTNTGSSAISVNGWKMDDNSNSFSNAVPMSGITSIAAGESVIFIENKASSFLSTWFAANAPAGLQIGTYSGSGVGLSTSGDAVNVYNSAGTLLANVSFSGSPSGSPLATFDNAAGLNNTAISRLSVVGVNGAFVADRKSVV